MRSEVLKDWKFAQTERVAFNDTFKRAAILSSDRDKSAKKSRKLSPDENKVAVDNEALISKLRKIIISSWEEETEVGL